MFFSVKNLNTWEWLGDLEKGPDNKRKRYVLRRKREYNYSPKKAIIHFKSNFRNNKNSNSN